MASWVVVVAGAEEFVEPSVAEYGRVTLVLYRMRVFTEA